MTGFEIELTQAAERDLEDIWYFIAQENLLAADKVLNALKLRINSLSTFPERAQLRPDISESARCLVQGNYLVIYKVTETKVVVVRVAHGAIDLTRLHT